MIEFLHFPGSVLAFSSPGLFGSIWWEMPNLEAVQMVYEARLTHEKNQPGEFVMLTLLKLSKIRSMSSEVREYTKETRKGLDMHCRADATVLETSAGSIGESVARFAITAINLMNRSSMPNRLFVTQEEAIQWLTSFSTLSANQIKKVVDEALRSKK